MGSRMMKRAACTLAACTLKTSGLPLGQASSTSTRRMTPFLLELVQTSRYAGLLLLMPASHYTGSVDACLRSKSAADHWNERRHSMKGSNSALHAPEHPMCVVAMREADHDVAWQVHHF